MPDRAQERVIKTRPIEDFYDAFCRPAAIHLDAEDFKARRAEHKAHPFFVAIEDTAAQVGQGIIADRNKEMLGMSDAGVMYLRRRWRGN